ncbi:hypothetical protein I3842_02G084200 [Carya illinoinensis]|uniref:RING-type E3 ubiquitin transferase n=1 Tax=Carya illinoinensis TaxID=32201 RepID=A0A922K2R8_CARIL|nr:hypothetical protein I3842_02G084200 [Carya illinoinensis]
MKREKFVSEVIWPAIRGKSCPICLKDLEFRGVAVLTVCTHAYCVECIRKWSNLRRRCPLCNADFDSWFCKVNLSSRTFCKERLSALSNRTRNVDVEVELSRRIDPRRIVRRTRDELYAVSRRTRPLPWQRSFGRPGSVPPDVIAERILKWRASIYGLGLRAIPLSPRNCIEQNLLGNIVAREKIVQRIEPWIRRELQAILGDPDPSVIVHVATSLFIASLEKKNNANSERLDGEDNLMAPLRPFLQDRTNMFLHELRCFAESSLNVDAYDAVVEYE